jgi:hypothetical protein
VTGDVYWFSAHGDYDYYFGINFSALQTKVLENIQVNTDLTVS